MSITQDTKQKGFTLIEMLVSIALFSVVLTVTIGAILTIADSNKKARSLMSVTNNLNFAIDSMTRSIKSGQMNNNSVSGNGGNAECLETEQINYSGISAGDTADFTRETVEYCYDPTDKTITQQIEGGNIVPIISDDVTVDYLDFELIPMDGNQYRVLILIGGTVKVSEKISSEFSIQTTVAQRQLNLPN